MEDLDALRKRIDALDADLARAFEERMKVSRKVAEYKRGRGMNIYDAEREREVLKSRSAMIGDESLRGAAEAFFSAIMTWSRDEQQKVIGPVLPRTIKEAREGNLRVAYQGIPGAYGSQAALEIFPGAGYMPCERFEDVFEAVVSDRADYGVLPLENSLTGSINEVYDLLGQYGCFISAEKSISVGHCLLGLPGAAIEDIREVYSHEQGFTQCAAFLKRYPAWKLTPYFNTAVAAKRVAESGQKSVAAIANRHAAGLYGLSIIRPDIQDRPDNHTRFIAVAPRLAEGVFTKTSLLLRLKHEKGSLLRTLEVLYAYGLNMTKIESRPIRGCRWEYCFYIDVEGDVGGEAVGRLLNSLKEAGAAARLLGRYHAERLGCE